MWAPICQVGKWQGMFGEVDVTHEKMDRWVDAFGPDEKIPVTFGHLSDPDNPTSTGTPSACWISGLMKAGDLLLGNYVDWTPDGLGSISTHAYKNVSIESKDGSRINSVALLGARDPAVKFHNDKGRFAPLDMSGCLGEPAQILLAQGFEETKQAAGAAKGVSMSFKEKAIAALKDVAAKLEGEPEEAATLASPAPVEAAAPPVVESAKVEALAAEVKELKQTVATQKVEFTAQTLLAESKQLCIDASAAPRFEKPLAQLLALIPSEAEVVLAEADDPEKVVKAPAREFFKNVLTAKGTAKLEDPAALTKPPKKKLVKPLAASDKKGMPDEEDALAELSEKARARAVEKGITIDIAQAEVLAEFHKEQGAE